MSDAIQAMLDGVIACRKDRCASCGNRTAPILLFTDRLCYVCFARMWGVAIKAAHDKEMDRHQ